ncbi:MAG TPA: response regulator, partial [Gemmataceae bacterium]|nr:response regulator [Gemmataceae bacterium]
LKLLSSHAFRERKHLANQFALGEGLVGQSALERERLVITDVPDDYIKIGSGLGESKPRNIVVLPVLFEGEVKAVVELASFNRYNETHLAFLDRLTESIGIVLNTIAATTRTEELLKQSQALAEESQAQQKELKESNARLEEQTASLRASEELLKKQQEELKQTNEELEEKARELTTQKAEVDTKNREIELAKLAVQERAEQLALTSKYKSEFLANMSHELRSPLNSLLILAEMLTDNTDGNLSPKQTEFAQTIYASGSDLLSLINDILDMAKIESGTMTVEVGEVLFADLQEFVDRTFRPVAQNRELQFDVGLAANLPRGVSTDSKRLQQVLRNLLSNAFKFTEHGKVSLWIETAKDGWSIDHPVLSRAETVLAFSVSDTGIGIAPDKLRVIFEPFQQGDMGTGRKYGGTGLGLSISREIARLLGGEIRVHSTVDEGSTFTLYLPQAYLPQGQVENGKSKIEDGGSKAATPSIRSSILDPRSSILDLPGGDRDAIEPGDRVVLIVEHDPKFAGILLDTAHQKGFKGLVISSGEAAMALARQLRPDAVTLDIRLPDMDGWVVLDRLKHDPTTRHIPVHVISVDESSQRGSKLGAFSWLRKPVSKNSLNEAFSNLKNFVERREKKLLVVEDNDVERDNIVKLIGNGDVQTTAVRTAGEAIAALQTTAFDCLVLDLMLPDMSGIDLLEKIKKELDLPGLPVIVYTGKDLTEAETRRLEKITETVILKDARSLERLLDKTALFLHRLQANLPSEARQLVRHSQQTDPVLAGRKVLLVDDDLRNLFALTSMMERWQMEVLQAESGREGLGILLATPGIDLVLMDIMMPDMDGYETTRAIRGLEQFRSLPIIALTAKAMKGDRQKCLDAGTSDYIAKPVSAEQLLSLLRVWLSRTMETAQEA